MLEVITAKDRDGNELSTAQVKADWPQLKAAHEKALKEEPTWQFFGGVLTVNGHDYQVR